MMRRLSLFSASLVVFILALARPIPAAAQATAPRVVITVNMPTADLLVTDLKYRVMFNKSERKTIPLTDFDFASNVGDELETALADVQRAKWQFASPAERESLGSFFGPNSYKKSSFPPSSVGAERALLVSAAYGAMISGFRKFVEVSYAVRMAEPKTGRILWKKTFTQRTGLPDTLEDMQADNQKVLKETLIKVMEQLTPKVKVHVSTAKL